MKESDSDSHLHGLSILVVDDEPDLRLGLTRLLARTGAELEVAASAEQALGLLRDREVDLLITDIRMPGMSGIDLLHEVKRHFPLTEVILITGFGTIGLAVECLHAGAVNFLSKPFDNDEMLHTVSMTGKRILAAKGKSAVASETGLIAAEASMKAVLELVRQVAATRVPVLIHGESGTGKELIARAIHEQSGVSKPLIAVNCAALPDTLLESELFGFRKGAFTGAERHYDGIFKRADGSTLFLDEVSSMSLAFQAKLLRVLQEKSIRPLGAEENVHTDFRLLAAGNRDLMDMVRAGQFREDLYYRLNVFTIDIPPLRERPGDIEALALHFIVKAARICLPEGVRPPLLSTEAVLALQRYHWPGNVRELENAVQRAVILSRGAELFPHHFFLDAAPSVPSGGRGESYEEAKQRILDGFQRQFIQRVLERSNGNISHAAEDCGLTRAAIQKIMRRLNIDRGDFERD
jgi:DNA-binding NtrC family response regulator